MMPSPVEQRNHAIQAAATRYSGLRLTPDTYQSLCERITYGDGANLVLVQNPGREVWDLVHEGRKLRAVYDTRRKNIVTFLPRNGIPGQRTGNDPR